MTGSMVSVFSHPAAGKDGSLRLDSCAMRGLQGSALGPDRRSALYTSDPEIKTVILISCKIRIHVMPQLSGPILTYQRQQRPRTVDHVCTR